MPLVNDRVDTMALAMRDLPDLRRASLDKVATALGLAPRKVHRAEGDAELTARAALVLFRIAAEHGVTRSAVLLAWAMGHPAGVVPIIGTQQPARIRECARAVDVELTRDEWYQILVAGRGEAMP